MTIKEFSSITSKHPLSIHINPIGLIRLGRSNDEIFKTFNHILNQIETYGGNIAIPTYSYSYAKKENYDIINTPSDLDESSNYLLQKNSYKRTIDGNFSYLLFGNNFSKHHFHISKTYASFGEDSLIEEIFFKDGYLGAIGGALEYLTEIHYLERLLKVSYRFDKKFKGITIDKDRNIYETELIYYCRDLESNYSVSFVQLKHDLQKAGLIQLITFNEYRLKIELIKFHDIYKFIKKRIIDTPKYLWEKI